MASPFTVAIALVGLLGSAGVFAYVARDARRVGLSRPRAWGSIAAVPLAIGLGLYLFVPAAPLTGTILTANTGLVLYGFEREVAQRGDKPADPGELPGGSPVERSNGSAAPSSDDGDR